MLQRYNSADYNLCPLISQGLVHYWGLSGLRAQKRWSSILCHRLIDPEVANMHYGGFCLFGHSGDVS
jgi:hypothetical protein